MMQTSLEKLDLCLSLDFDIKTIICLTFVSLKRGKNNPHYHKPVLLQTLVTHLSYGFVKYFFQELY